MENKEIEFRKNVLLSAQKALWGMIYPAIRAICVGYEGSKKLSIIWYLDREPTQEDYENLSEVTTEICADINFLEVEEQCVFSDKLIRELNSLTSWVYIRKE